VSLFLGTHGLRIDPSPLNSIGLPYYETPLLSTDTRDLHQTSVIPYPPPARIPAQVLNTMKTFDFVGYASLPRELRGKRNMVFGGSKNKPEGRFRSNKTSRVRVVRILCRMLPLTGNGGKCRLPLIRQQASCILQIFHASTARWKLNIRSLVSRTLILGMCTSRSSGL
jgi:hypothetical protein